MKNTCWTQYCRSGNLRFVGRTLVEPNIAWKSEVCGKSAYWIQYFRIGNPRFVGKSTSSHQRTAETTRWGEQWALQDHSASPKTSRDYNQTMGNLRAITNTTPKSSRCPSLAIELSPDITQLGRWWIFKAKLQSIRVNECTARANRTRRSLAV